MFGTTSNIVAPSNGGTYSPPWWETNNQGSGGWIDVLGGVLDIFKPSPTPVVVQQPQQFQKDKTGLYVGLGVGLVVVILLIVLIAGRR